MFVWKQLGRTVVVRSFGRTALHFQNVVLATQDSKPTSGSAPHSHFPRYNSKWCLLFLCFENSKSWSAPNWTCERNGQCPPFGRLSRKPKFQNCEFKIKSFTASISTRFIYFARFHRVLVCLVGRPPLEGNPVGDATAHTYTHDAWAARRQPKTNCQNQEGLSYLVFHWPHCATFEVWIIVMRLKSGVHSSSSSEVVFQLMPRKLRCSGAPGHASAASSWGIPPGSSCGTPLSEQKMCAAQSLFQICYRSSPVRDNYPAQLPLLV